MRKFIDTAKKLDIFNMAAVRDLAKQTQLISDVNPAINNAVALERDLFHSAATATPRMTMIYDEFEPATIDIETLENEAVLYTIEVGEIKRNTQSFMPVSKENRIGILNFNNVGRQAKKTSRW